MKILGGVTTTRVAGEMFLPTLGMDVRPRLTASENLARQVFSHYLEIRG